ncbi:MAG TPA: UDP-3-O-(3-hydroxymyristoyl)glucosamine N-acyltransferase [Gemmatimonadaceae bacterium]|nr:UDP-3-O-(3-hydroxymyristoyl)glucosamine N-acyltransferase [Gemmatimonadaceae bacterium]
MSETALTAEAVAHLVGGELRGDASVRVVRVAALDRATPNELSFFANPRYAAEFESSSAGLVLVSPELAGHDGGPQVRVVVAKPQEAMLLVLPALYPPPPRATGIHPSAVIGAGAKLGKDVAIGAHSVIGEHALLADRVVIGPLCDVGRDVTIGEDSHLVSGVTLYPGTILGARVRLHAGVRVGSDGFGYVPTKSGVQKIPHVGRAILEDDVEVGANSTIDRGSIADTVIGAGTKLDNLVMIAHNVRLGRMCLIAAQSGIAGSTRLGDGCMIGGQVGVTGHLELGNNVKLGAGSGVMDDIPDGQMWSGAPARPQREWLKATSAFYKLADRLREIERQIRERDT